MEKMKDVTLDELQMARHFDAGHRCFRAGMGLDEAPTLFGRRAMAAWKRGWHKAKKDAQ